MLHARIVDAIEALYRERLTEQIERLAHHALRGEVWEKAVGYLRQAGAKAVSALAPIARRSRSAKQALASALDLPGELARRPSTPSISASSSATRRPCLRVLPALLEHLREAERAGRRTLGDQRRLGWVYDYLSHYHFNAGNHAEPRRPHERSRSRPISATSAPRLRPRSSSGTPTTTRAEYRRAVDLLRRSRTGARGAARLPSGTGWPSLRPSLSATGWRWHSPSLGSSRDGVRRTEEAVRIAEALGPCSRSDATPLGSAAICICARGLRPGRPWLLEDGLARCRAAFPGLLHNLAGPLGRAYVLSGRVGDALPLLPEALACATSGGVIGRHSRLTTYLAEGYLHAHRVDEAREAALRPLTSRESTGARGRGLGAPPAWRDRRARRPARRRNRRGALRRGHDPGLRARDAPPRRPLPPRPRQALPANRATDAKAAEHLTTASGDVPRDGHGVLAGAGGRGVAVGQP